MKTTMKRVFSLLMALLCAVSIAGTALTPAYAASQADLNALQQDEAKLEQRKKKLERELKKLSGDWARVLERRELLDRQANVTVSEIANVEKQISQYALLIDQAEKELKEAEEEEERQYTLFCKRVRAMEKGTRLDYWSVLFRSASFTDLLSNLDMVNEIMNADQRIMDQLRILQEEIKERKTALEEDKTASEAAKAKLIEKKKLLDQQREEAVALMKTLDASKAEYQSVYNQLEAEEERIQREIVRMSQELAEKEGNQPDNGKPRPAPNAARGGYIWPVNSRRINSPYGPRPSPGGIGSRFHKGIDIGGVGYNTVVHAAKSGTVIVSQYSRSYGNYIVISHAAGNTTLYAHMSSRKVKKGQYVKQGAPIGVTGSTGRSTGPHLHFEITENGKRINPAKYLK